MRQTITQLLQSACQKIDKLDADLLLSFILDKPREYFMIHEDEFITNTSKNKFNKLVKKRQSGIPFAYITEHKEFFGLDFIVNKHTLIPRPDTEIMVEEVIREINNKQLTTNKLILIDVGTGTGCIPISILKNTKEIKTFAIDISKPTLCVAKKNAKKHKVKIKFLHGNLLEPILNYELRVTSYGLRNSKIIITANLPYLTIEQYQSEKSIQSEPKSALVARPPHKRERCGQAKNEGLALYEELLNQIKQLINNNNLVPSPPARHASLQGVAGRYNLVPTTYLEIDPSQSEKITALIKKILPETKVEIKKDLGGRNRTIIIT